MLAKPTYHPDWAVNDVNLSATGNVNKVRPRQAIRDVGWDKGQIPTAEELNWTFNNYGLWIHYLTDEVLPTLPNTYLPLTGTKLTFTGGATGTVTWNGNKEASISLKITDNSHKHLSADISDATANPTPDTIVKRNSSATIIAGDIISRGVNPSLSDTPSFFLQTYNGKNVGLLDSSNVAGGNLNINRVNPDTGVSVSVTIWDDNHVELPNPRSSTAQEGQSNSLVRYDYLSLQVSNLSNNIDGHVNNLVNIINTQANNSAATYVRTFRLTGGGTATNNNDDNTFAVAPDGSVVTAVQQRTNYTAVQYKYLQYNINNNWYTVGVS